MTFLASLNDHVGKLVHPELHANAVEYARHRIFLASRLTIPLGAFVIAPLFLVTGHGPTFWEAAALALLLLPFGAVIHVSRTGNLAAGEAVSLATWLALGFTLTLGSGSPVGLGLLLLVPLETALSSGSPFARRASFIASTSAVLLSVGLGAFPRSGPGPGLASCGIVAAAVVYGSILAVSAHRLLRLRVHHARLDRERYRVMSDALEDALMRFDRAGGVLFASSSTTRLFGVPSRDIMGRGFFEHVHVSDRPAFLKLVADLCAEPGAEVASLRVRTGRILSQGGLDEPVFVWVELRAKSFASSPDDPRADRTTVVAQLRDVTAQKTSELALEDARRAEARSTAGRDLFLASVSHELRTPLNAIIGFAELLASDVLAPRDSGKQREYASIIEQSGHHLLAVVNSILDASKLESGSFDFAPEPFRLTELIGTCCDMVTLKADQAGVAVLRELPTMLADVTGDRRACKQIVLNLLSNALKFTPPNGRVTIGARPDGNSVVLFVADTGIGIAARDLPRLGDPFFQAQGSYDRLHDGTGLGLSVVRGLVGLHGGSMSIESAPGEGTLVSVRLPFDCRRVSTCATALTRIETIPRYHLALQPTAGASDAARVDKVA